MKIILVGYGRMGKEVEAVCLKKGHEIVAKVDPVCGEVPVLTKEIAEKADIAIEFSLGDSVYKNLKLVTLKAARIMGSMGGTGEFETVLNFTLNQPEIARQLITHQIPFVDFHQAFELVTDRKNAMKVLLKF